MVSFEPLTFSAITGVVFDLDGTLIDSAPGIGIALASAFEAAGRTMPSVDMRGIIGPPIAAIVRSIEPSITASELAVIERAYRSGYDTVSWRDTLAFPGVTDTLQALHREHLRLFIVTNKPLVPTAKIMDHLDLDRFFVEILTRDSRTPGYAGKAEMLADLLSRRGLDPRATLMVGDTIEDQESARANGLIFIHASYGYGSVPQAHQRIAEVSELVTLLRCGQKTVTFPQKAAVLREI